jgi:transcriptional regulator of acetoin/glycerol metabolism
MTEKAVILGEGSRLREADFFQGQGSRAREPVMETLNLDALERDAIERAIAKNGGNISRAVKELGISRRALYYKLRKYDI